MRNYINKAISLILALIISGCTTTSYHQSGFINATNVQDVYVKNFEATKSHSALFVNGTLVNKHGSAISNVEIEARAYDKDNQLVSTDSVTLAPTKIKSNEEVNFSMTFTKNADQIVTYYLLGKYDTIGTNVNVNWNTVGKVILVAAAVTAVVAVTYYAAESGGGGGQPVCIGSSCAKAVYVRGYYRTDGTYVRPHYRSAPDEYIWNNFGPSQTQQELLNPDTRDFDHDGIPNYLDPDDDNDGIPDEYDPNPYGR